MFARSSPRLLIPLRKRGHKVPPHAPTSGVLEIGWAQMLWAALAVLVSGGASVWLGLRLERSLFVAALRCVVQLLLIGYVLRWVFGLHHPLLLAGVLALMTGAASHAAWDRSARTYRGAGVHAFVVLAACGLLTTAFITGAIVGAQPWWTPRYAVPIFGMALGSALTGVSLCLDSLLEAFDERRHEIDAELALGATAWEAARAPVAAAVRRGIVPAMNGMAVAGLVSLPGMMTGQILAGVDPAIAVRYQIVLLILPTAATVLGCIGAALLACRVAFTAHAQLRPERITRRKP